MRLQVVAVSHYISFFHRTAGALLRSIPPGPPFALLLHNSIQRTKREFLLCSGVPEFKVSSFTLDFLPWSRLGITVINSCEDLLLCCNNQNHQSDYVVVNPITHQWISLPPALRIHGQVLVGFVCKPGSVVEARKGGELSYTVVRIGVFAGSRNEFNVEIFSSEDGQWNEYNMTLEDGLKTQVWRQSGVAFNGCLYWQYEYAGIKVLRYDPFNPVAQRIHIIEKMDDTEPAPKECVLGICQDNLMMSQISWYDDIYKEASSLSIWELQEAEWHLAKLVPFKEILALNLGIIRRQSLQRCRILAFHPIKRDVLYLECAGSDNVICCNLRRMSLEIIRGYELDKIFRKITDAIPFVGPWWPTPLPT